MKGLEKVLKYAAICLICLMCLIPFYVLLVLALNSPQRVFFLRVIFLFRIFYWQNFLDAWRKSKIGTAMLNSAIITAGTLIFDNYYRWPGRGMPLQGTIQSIANSYSVCFLSCMMIPGIINTVPLYTYEKNSCGKYPLGNDFGLLHTGNAVCGVHLRNIYKSAAKRIGRSGCVGDGCTGFSAFWRVIFFPIIKPATASFVILNGFGIWNNYAQATFFLQSRAKQNIPQALSVFFQQFGGGKWHLMAATATIAIIPVVIIFLIFQKQFIRDFQTAL